MTFEVLLVLAVLLGAVLCFATERLPVDLVALLVLSALLASSSGWRGTWGSALRSC
jgi:hypothetical protein